MKGHNDFESFLTMPLLFLFSAWNCTTKIDTLWKLDETSNWILWVSSAWIHLLLDELRKLAQIGPTKSKRGKRCQGLFTWYRNDFHSGMSFVPECSLYCIHMAKSTVGFLSCMFFFFYTKNKDGASFAGRVIVPINGHICKFNLQLDHWAASLGWTEKTNRSFRSEFKL